ncbi:MAG: TlpA family protein disulfide reductase [Bacteroidetes bacterium]|nr:TlpA family protein disulfide reductase [Bacteroidota bacterium]
MRYKNILFLIVIIVVISGLSILAGALNWINQFIIVGTLFFIGGLVYNKRFGLKRSVYGFLVLLPFIIIYGGVVVSSNAIHVYPIAFLPLITCPIGLLINSKFGVNASVRKYTYSALFVIFLAILGYLGMPNWLAYVFSKPGEQETVQISAVHNLKLRNEHDSTFYLGDLKGKIVVLDFWSTSCAICLKQFPEFDKLYNYYKFSSEVEFYAVNLSHKGQTSDEIKKVITNYNYSFPTLFTSNEEAKQIKSIFQFNAVPTLIIMGKDGRVEYKGELITADHVIVNNTYRKLNKLINKEFAR